MYVGLLYKNLFFFCSNIYKLSDFGTAKPVLETEAFQSLVGTEEYLVCIVNNDITKCIKKINWYTVYLCYLILIY